MVEKPENEGRASQPKRADQRKARLAAALRDNLRKRKDQARNREAGEVVATVPPETSIKR